MTENSHLPDLRMTAPISDDVAMLQPQSLQLLERRLLSNECLDGITGAHEWMNFKFSIKNGKRNSTLFDIA
jgi:hypothetical protein